MGRNRGAFVLTLLVMFVLFLSLISIVFSLDGGFFIFELILLLVFMLWGLVALAGLIFEFNVWKGLIVFYMLNFVNILVVYFFRFSLKEITLPFVMAGVGFLLALLRAGEEDIEDIEPVIEEKYVASEKGKVYHVAGCEKAKRIKNPVEYTKEEAESAGKKACDCVV